MVGQSLNPDANLSAGYEKVPWKENDYAVNLNEMRVMKADMVMIS